MIQPVSEHPRNRQSPPIVMMSMSCSHFIFLRKITKCANNPTLEYSCFEKKINLRIVYGREFFSNWEKNNVLRKNETSEFFLIFHDLLDGHGAWLMEYTRNPSVYNIISCNSLIQLEQTMSSIRKVSEYASGAGENLLSYIRECISDKKTQLSFFSQLLRQILSENLSFIL